MFNSGYDMQHVEDADLQVMELRPRKKRVPKRFRDEEPLKKIIKKKPAKKFDRTIPTIPATYVRCPPNDTGRDIQVDCPYVYQKVGNKFCKMTAGTEVYASYQGSTDFKIKFLEVRSSMIYYCCQDEGKDDSNIPANLPPPDADNNRYIWVQQWRQQRWSIRAMILPPDDDLLDDDGLPDNIGPPSPPESPNGRIHEDSNVFHLPPSSYNIQPEEREAPPEQQGYSQHSTHVGSMSMPSLPTNVPFAANYHIPHPDLEFMRGASSSTTNVPANDMSAHHSPQQPHYHQPHQQLSSHSALNAIPVPPPEPYSPHPPPPPPQQLDQFL